MRLSKTAFLLTALLAAAACGDDEPEETAIPRPASQQRPVVDTTLGDTAGGEAAGGEAAGGEAAGGEAGAAADRAGDRTGQTGQAARSDGETAGTDDPGGERGPDGASGQRLYTVQVAAFTSEESARTWTGRLSSLDLPVWMSTAEVGGTTYYRVRVGAVSSVSEARRLGAMLSQRLEWPVWVAPVSASERMPDDALASTRRILEGR